MKVVIVEYEIRIREGVEKLIKRIPKEYEMIVTAENGEEGLQIVLEHQPEIVITDIKMPKMDGIEMLSKLKALGKMHVKQVKSSRKNAKSHCTERLF